MLNVIVTDPPRADLAEVDKLADYGVATVHEAIGRSGYLGPAIRPNQQGTRIAGTALTVLCWPGDNLMIHAAVEQARPGDIIVITTASPNSDGAFGELLATSLVARGVRGLVMGAGLRDTQELRDMGFPAWTAHVSAQGTVKETTGSVNVPVTLGGQIDPARATRSSPTTTACASCRARTCDRRSPRPPPRVAKEDANRKQLADGVLGARHVRPAARSSPRSSCISYAEYVKRAGEGTEPIERMRLEATEARPSRRHPLHADAGRDVEGRCTSSPATSRPTRPSATTCCCGSWGRPDPRQIDGIGGAHPLTSKVAVGRPRAATGRHRRRLPVPAGHGRPAGRHRQAELRQHPGRASGRSRSSAGLVAARAEQTSVRIRMVNTGELVTATFPTPGGRPRYDGDTAIDGVPGTAAPIVLDFEDAGSGQARVFPTGNVTDDVRRHHR